MHDYAGTNMRKPHQPSGSDGGDCVGPSWFDGVGGPLMVALLMANVLEFWTSGL